MARLTLRLPVLRFLFTSALTLTLSAPGFAAVHWLPFGPDGGDARAFATDPHDHKHLYLGTTNGWIYETHNEGESWRRLAQLAKRDDLVLDNIVVDQADSRHLLVGAWVLGRPDGGMFISHDAGASWTNASEMKGQSVISLAQAPSDPKTFVAGTLAGVFRSSDSGSSWTRISPVDSKEIHNVESIAIDPRDPQIIYAGTWHLPWKTTDGGEKWSNIKQGIIEDSDVFSIIVDPAEPRTVYASACSGIYKSEDAGAVFKKVQGIPTSARRTRVLMQDPNHPDTVFAGTTEGLFRTQDAGKTWKRTTGPELIVNDVYVDPSDPSKVMLATDRSGVLVSSDGGDSFRPANLGFSARQISSFAQEREHPAVLYIGVVNDKEWGGVFQSQNGGLNWVQVSAGLFGRDVFSLDEAPDGSILAGTSHGIFRLNNYVWQRVETPVRLAGDAAHRRTAARTPAHAHPQALPPAKVPVAPAETAIAPAAGAVPGAAPVEEKESSAPLPPNTFDGAVLDMATAGNTVFATTSHGLLSSPDSGATWSVVAAVPRDDWRFVAAAHAATVIATLHTGMRSLDEGRTWKAIGMPEGLTQVGAIAIQDTGVIWIGGREGLFYSNDDGATWSSPKNLTLNGVNSLFFDEPRHQLLITSAGEPTVAFTLELSSLAVSFHDTGWNLRFIRPEGDHLIGATLFDGIVVQPRMVASPIIGSSTPPASAAGKD